MFLRQIEHLLPRAHAWRMPFAGELRKLFRGLVGAPSDLRDYCDGIHTQLDPQLTTELPTWQKQFGLFPTGTESDQRNALASAWQQQGGQSPNYLQSVVRAAGFDVYIHEWPQDVASLSQIECGEPLAACGEPRAECADRGINRFVHNPLLYTDQPLSGTVQCGNPPGTAGVIPAECGEPDAMCNGFLANSASVRYLVNKDLSQNAPPSIPTNSDSWHYFLYWGGPTLDDDNPSLSTNWASIPAARKVEFERLILKLCPMQQWLVTVVNYTS